MERLKQRATDLFKCTYLSDRRLWPLVAKRISDELARQQAPAPLLVLDIGCGERPYEDLFAKCHYVGINRTAIAARPDIVADAMAMPIRDASVDLVLCTQVLEHVPNPLQLVHEAYRVLKPGGGLVLSAPFYWPVHEEPSDFFRFTQYGLQNLTSDAGFAQVQCTADAGTITQIALSMALALPKFLFFLVPLVNLAGLLLQPLSDDRGSTLNYVVTARKPE